MGAGALSWDLDEAAFAIGADASVVILLSWLRDSRDGHIHEGRDVESVSRWIVFAFCSLTALTLSH